MHEVDVVVIGAGAVGMACAALLATRGESVVAIERHASCGSETSSRNSGVIHAGLYYPTGSLKARLCVRGRELLYARALRDEIPHRKLGKLVVATDASDEPRLEALADLARNNGVMGLRMLGASELHKLEQAVHARRALWSTETGIVDPHALVDSYRRQALAHGAELCLCTQVTAIEQNPSGYRVDTRQVQTGERHSLRAAAVVNAAGLEASRIAASAGLAIEQLGYVQYLCKGDYFKVHPRIGRQLGRLIYPLPVHAGLGVHLTIDNQGEVRAGPDVTYVAAPDYQVDAEKRAGFAAAIQRYLPAITSNDLEPDFAGLRPKLQAAGEPFRDFVIEEASPHGLPGFVNLIGIESPGLTASEAIAEQVLTLLPAQP